MRLNLLLLSLQHSVVSVKFRYCFWFSCFFAILTNDYDCFSCFFYDFFFLLAFHLLWLEIVALAPAKGHHVQFTLLYALVLAPLADNRWRNEPTVAYVANVIIFYCHYVWFLFTIVPYWYYRRVPLLLWHWLWSVLPIIIWPNAKKYTYFYTEQWICVSLERNHTVICVCV